MSSQAEAVALDTTPLVGGEVASGQKVAGRGLRTLFGERTEQGLSSLTARGGLYLGLRYGLGVLISIGNMFVLTWWIGPHAYGIFVMVAGLTAFLASLTRGGVDTYLVRRADEPDEGMYHVASTLILGLTIMLSITGVLLLPLLTRWYASREFVPAYLAMLLTVPLVGLAGPPTAKLERELNFRAVAQIELGGQVLALLVSLELARRGFGVWAAVAGNLAWQLCVVLGASAAARYRPRLRFDASCAREMLSFGAGYTASLRAWQLRTLVNPLLVGRFVGSEGVAFVGLAIRVAESLGFLRIAAARLAIAALARIQEDREKFRAAVEGALRIQVMVLGPLLCVFAWIGPVLVPRVMGVRWAPSLRIYPFVAAGVLVNSVFNLQASALFVGGRQWVVLKAYASHVLLLAFGTFLLIPRFGLVAYGWADLGACAAYIFLQAGVSRMLGISYRRLLPWLVAFVAPLFVSAAHYRWSLVLCLPLLGMAVAGASKWRSRSDPTAGLERFRSGLTRSPGIRHCLTFFWKARQRGWRYVATVVLYQARSRGYRLRMAIRWLLNLRVRPRVEQESCGGDAPSRVGQGPAFHFRPEDIPAIVRSIPQMVRQEAIAEAQRVLQNRFCFRGIEHAFSGEVDWEARPQGSLSWQWDLNRHRYFVSLGTAYYYTGEQAYLT